MDEKQESMRKAAEAVTRELADQGRIIEGGFRAMAIITGLDQPGITEVQRSEMRKAYFFGAQHLFASMFQMMEPGVESTEADERRLSLIFEELKKFVQELKAQEGN